MTDEIIVDNFAGGGGASLGIEQAAGASIDIAINHDPEAIAMHRANHPDAEHYCESVYDVDPVKAVRGRKVGLAWFSPDCKHFSRAKGGKPVDKKIRSLAWVVVQWAAKVRPRILIIENVEEFVTWGPLSKGQPCPKRRGDTFVLWVEKLRSLGYTVEWRLMRACDFGAPTIRKRLFVIARCDGLPIEWPAATHGEDLAPYRTAAECIDWSLQCQSIFDRKRPLAENTLRRIAKGIQRYVIDAEKPFIIKVNHKYEYFRGQPIAEPLQTVTKYNGFGLVVPHLSRQFGQGVGRGVDGPAPTVTPGGQGKSALVSAFLAQHNTGVVGHRAEKPLSTITGRGTQQQVVASSLVKLRGTCRDGQAVTDPMPTVTASGNHVAEVRAFLIKYFGTAVGQSVADPAHTVTARARLGLVTVAGEPYRIVDIGMRMLQPRELYRAQGFPDSYIIDPEVRGKPLTKTAQVRMCGNSVSPPAARAIVIENLMRRPLRAAG